ncbi:MAG TPA: PDGLE domain-containing protein [Anaerolineae bacterium]|nr:PDGLE domain-containing protein [Anaerolineae bacterium]
MKLLRKYWWVFGLLLALGLALLSPLASPHPDGLERVAEDQGFLPEARRAPYELVADYLFPGIENEGLATVVAGVAGTLILFGLGTGLAWILRRRAAREAPKGHDAA